MPRDLNSSSEGVTVSSDTEISIDHHSIIRQSRLFPKFLWVFICILLGIKRSENERPTVSTILYACTFLSGLGYTLTTCIFAAFDVISEYTKTTVITGTGSVVYTIFWTSFGIYANQLAYKLYTHPHFQSHLKFHSKTILKINVAFILLILMTLFIIINNIGGYYISRSKTCNTVALESVLCQSRFTTRVLFSILSLIWNFLVSFAIISICRSHVISIRKVMKRLENDSRISENKYFGTTNKQGDRSPPLKEYTWIEEDYMQDLQQSTCVSRDQTPISLPTDVSEVDGASSVDTGASVSSLDRGFLDSGRPEASLTNQDILFHYWKIQSDLRVSSVAFQRWMMSVISLVAIWLAVNLVTWSHHNPNLVDFINFFLPLMLLPLLASAYAEVNQEGSRLLKYICPLEHRLQLLFVLQQYPLEMNVFGLTLSYSTIVTAAFGVLLALASKILLQEIFTNVL